ncbi:MAG: DUF255 domain-containing protein [Saprospiraceae bacterium]|nr:DUF255 domain-containing protein [Saprospiraceae bacterium]MCB0626675.1 DUF255 domain-containing protein [Saprospiraceae bacterium]MCB0677742.1 DUF255 domain-containing protein [Saprospiraceae bacterium]MCB0682769.1 DUF255 domain-containing protein [Saprospiraceae bacterium]
MKRILPFAALLLLAALIFSFVVRPDKAAAETAVESAAADAEFKWYTWDEAVAASAKSPKKIMVDVYTDWCGWCKRMDKSTFSDEGVQAFLKDKFYAVKLDAEQKEDINFRDYTFKWVDQGRRGVHELAVQLLQGRMSYPSIVYLNEDFEIITTSPGYKDVGGLMKELTFIGDEHYLTTDWQQYSQQ